MGRNLRKLEFGFLLMFLPFNFHRHKKGEKGRVDEGERERERLIIISATPSRGRKVSR
jgi:hypothetical protein